MSLDSFELGLPGNWDADGLGTFETRLALARLGASLAHALGTPLQVISGRASLAASSTDLEEARQHVAIVVRKCREMSDFLQTAVTHLRGADAAAQTVEIGQFIRQTFERAIGLEAGSEAAVGGHVHVEWASNLSTVWHGRARVFPLAQALTRLFAGARRRHTAGPLKVELSRSNYASDESSLEVACEWYGAPLGAALQAQLSDPWKACADESERRDTLEFLMPYEAARQNGGSISFPTPTRFLLAWPIHAYEPDASVPLKP